jgi:UDP-glucuronate 4-epimerase
MKILVTGTAGFIGFHLAERLLEKGYEVIGIDNINDYYDVTLKYARLNESGISKELISYGKPIVSTRYNKYVFVKLDLTDKEGMDELFSSYEIDAVCNLAAQAGVRYSLTNPEAYIDSNIHGFLNVLECCRRAKIKQLLYASSSSVYGLNKKMPFSVNNNVDHPISLYAASKKSNELMAHAYSHLFNMPTTALRFFTVYGPWGRPDMALFIFTKAIFEGKPIEIFNNGNMSRDFTYIDDIVEGIVRLIEKPAVINPNWDALKPDPASSKAPYRIFNIGKGSPVTLLEFIEEIENNIGLTANKTYLPMQDGDVSQTWADILPLKTELGYTPKTSVKKGIQNFINWYRMFYDLTPKIKRDYKNKIHTDNVAFVQN